MTRPLKVRYDSPPALQEMTDAEIDYAAHQVQVVLAAQVVNTGVLAVNYNGASGTAIGTFTDTYRPDAIGTHPVGTTVTTVTNTFKQVQTINATAPVRPVEWSSTAMREQTDTELNTYIFNRVTARLNSVAPLGAYKLQAAAPTPGTWTSIATVTDTNQGGNVLSYLWKCTAYTAPTVVRPIKINSTDGVREMSDADLQTLFGKYTSFVSSTGIGKYAVQAAAPVGGTWVRMGTEFADTRKVLSDVAYTGAYSQAFTRTSSAAFTRTYTGFYSGTRSYAGSRTIAYTRNRIGVAYARPASYTRFWAGFNGGTFAGIEGYYAATYTGYYSSFYANTYVSGVAAYTGTSSGFFTAYYSSFYTGFFSGNYTGTTVSTTNETVSNLSLWLRIS